MPALVSSKSCNKKSCPKNLKQHAPDHRCAIFDCGKYYHPRCLVTPDHPEGLKSDHMETLAYIWYSPSVVTTNAEMNITSFFFWGAYI